VSWEDSRTVEEWLNGQPHQSWKQAFEEQGFLVSFILLDKYVEMLLVLKFCGFYDFLVMQLCIGFIFVAYIAFQYLY